MARVSRIHVGKVVKKNDFRTPRHNLVRIHSLATADRKSCRKFFDATLPARVKATGKNAPARQLLSDPSLEHRHRLSDPGRNPEKNP
jgi:hypothetical protein